VHDFGMLFLVLKML